MFPSPATCGALKFGLPRFTRLDITRSYRFESVSAAQSFVRHVVGAARSRHGSPKLYGSETAIFGEGSRRWSFKVYDKFSEMMHGRKKSFARYREGSSEAFDDELMQWSCGVVRFELTLRSLELEHLPQLIIRLGALASPCVVALEVWQDYYSRVSLNDNAIMARQEDIMEKSLSGSQRACLQLWRRGEDLRQVYPQNTFYRHRRALLELVAVDIASAPPVDPAAAAAPKLDPAGWDPAPIDVRQVEPRSDLKAAYRLL